MSIRSNVALDRRSFRSSEVGYMFGQVFNTRGKMKVEIYFIWVATALRAQGSARNLLASFETDAVRRARDCGISHFEMHITMKECLQVGVMS
jgi:hypothetical protein